MSSPHQAGLVNTSLSLYNRLYSKLKFPVSWTNAEKDVSKGINGMTQKPITETNKLCVGSLFKISVPLYQLFVFIFIGTYKYCSQHYSTFCLLAIQLEYICKEGTLF